MPRTRCCDCTTEPNAEFVNLEVSGSTNLNTLTTTGLADLACLHVDTNLIYADCVNNRVGFLDSTPSFVVDVNGTFRAVGTARFDSDLVVDNTNNLIFADVSGQSVGFLNATPVAIIDVEGTITNNSAIVVNTALTVNALSSDGLVDIIGQYTNSGTTLVHLVNLTSSYIASSLSTVFDALYIVPEIAGGASNINELNLIHAKIDGAGGYTGTIGSAIALHVENADDGGGSITTQYGVLIDSLSGAGTNYAIYTGSNGLVRFGGNTSIVGSDLTVDTNVLYVDSTNNRVGINTTPTVSMDVVGQALFTSTVTDVNGFAISSAVTSTASQARILNITGTMDGSNVIQIATLLSPTFSPTGAITTMRSLSVAGTLTAVGVLTVTTFAGGVFSVTVNDADVTVTDLISLQILRPTQTAGTIGTVYGLKVQDMTANTEFAIHSGTGKVYHNDRVGIKITSPTGQLHVNQSSSTGAIPSFHLEQDDVSEEFVRYTGQAAAATLTQSLVPVAAVASFTVNGYLKINIQDEGNQITDGFYYMSFGTLA